MRLEAIDGATAGADIAVLQRSRRKIASPRFRLTEPDRRHVCHALAAVVRSGDLSLLDALVQAKRDRTAELQALDTHDARRVLRYELRLLWWLSQLLHRLAEESSPQRRWTAAVVRGARGAPKWTEQRQPVITAIAPTPWPEASSPDGVRGSPALVAQAA